jgi:hypothetical protein
LPGVGAILRITQSDLEAELAIADGSAQVLSDYFRDVTVPHPNVLQSIVWCLLGAGAGNQRLRFASRNGRPPKKGEGPVLIDEAAAIDAFDVGDEGTLASYLKRDYVSESVRGLLAEAFSSEGSTKQKLVFKRARAGYPATALRTEIKEAELGHFALALKKQLCTWPKVDEELRKLGRLGQDETTRKRAVSAVRKATKKPPQ